MTLPDPATFLSGTRGDVTGWRAPVRRAADRALDAWLRASGALRRVDALAERTPRRSVLVMSVVREGRDLPLGLESDRHRVRVEAGMQAGLGKFQNLNALLERAGGERADWTLVVDDDVELPVRFVDRFVALCERFDLALAQPAQTLASHAAWRVARRRPRSLVRETRFVEIGPVTAFRADAADELLPFPALRFGWGLDLAWAAAIRARGLRAGVVDALPVRHEQATVASGYSSEEAIEEARRFLAERPYVTSAEAQETLVVHRSVAP